MNIFYAHSLDGREHDGTVPGGYIEGKPIDDWHRLEEHLEGTAELAALFAAEFGCGEWGKLAEVIKKDIKEFCFE